MKAAENTFAIFKEGADNYLFCKRRREDDAVFENQYVKDWNEELWIYLFSSHDRKSLEECAIRYNIISTNIAAIQKARKDGSDNDREEAIYS